MTRHTSIHKIYMVPTHCWVLEKCSQQLSISIFTRNSPTQALSTLSYLMWFNLLAILGEVVRGRKNHQLIQCLSSMPMWCASQVFTAWAHALGQQLYLALLSILQSLYILWLSSNKTIMLHMTYDIYHSVRLPCMYV